MNSAPLAPEPLAILCSGGLDSAVLLGEALAAHRAVYPIYVQVGSTWEAIERAYLERFLASMQCAALQPLTVLAQPVADLYGPHWSLGDSAAPDADSPDEAVFLPGRNVLLLAKAMIWCHLNQVPQIALAPLSANPFPDATPEFFRSFESVMNQSVGGAVRICWPYLHLAKVDVIRRGRRMPLEHTFSCIAPVLGQHCGVCNKCGERRRAFISAGVPDPTTYSASL